MRLGAEERWCQPPVDSRATREKRLTNSSWSTGGPALPVRGQERDRLAILPPLFTEFAQDADSGTYSGAVNPVTSAVSTMAHVVALSETHGIDAGVMRAAEGMARRVIGLGPGTDGFIRVAEVLGRH